MMAHKQGLLSGLVFHCSGGEGGGYQGMHSQLAAVDLSARWSTDLVKQVLIAYSCLSTPQVVWLFPPTPSLPHVLSHGPGGHVRIDKFPHTLACARTHAVSRQTMMSVRRNARARMGQDTCTDSRLRYFEDKHGGGGLLGTRVNDCTSD